MMGFIGVLEGSLFVEGFYSTEAFNRAGGPLLKNMYLKVGIYTKRGFKRRGRLFDTLLYEIYQQDVKLTSLET